MPPQTPPSVTSQPTDRLCPECGHEHSGRAFAGICLGCPCRWVPVELVDEPDPSPALLDAVTAVCRSIAELLELAAPLLRPTEVRTLSAAQAIARDLPFDDR
jgi:hypothetical protein